MIARFQFDTIELSPYSLVCLYVLVDRSSTAVGSSGSIAMSIITLHSATTEDPTASFSEAMAFMEPTDLFSLATMVSILRELIALLP